MDSDTCHEGAGTGQVMFLKDDSRQAADTGVEGTHNRPANPNTPTADQTVQPTQLHHTLYRVGSCAVGHQRQVISHASVVQFQQSLVKHSLCHPRVSLGIPLQNPLVERLQNCYRRDVRRGKQWESNGIC